MTPRDGTIAAAIARADMRERLALCLLVALARAVAAAPPGTIDDLLALLAAADEGDERD